MLRLPLLHPELLRALASAGHGSGVLISDGNYPHTTGSQPDATIVYLNLAPDLLTVLQVLEVLASCVPIEAASVMSPEGEGDPQTVAQYQTVIGDVPIQRLPRHAFYDAARAPDVAVVVATGDSAHYANLLLTIGVV